MKGRNRNRSEPILKIIVGKSFYSKLDVVKPFADLGIFLKMAILGIFFFVFVVSTHSK